LFGLDIPFGELAKTGVSWINHTPPYVGSTPEVEYIDLAALDGQDPHLILYTDGVDAFVHGEFVFRKGAPFKGSPAEVLGELLNLGCSARVDYLEEVLGHQIDLEWASSCGNAALGLLLHLLGGKNVDRLRSVLDQELISDENEDLPNSLYVDDTTIVVCPISRLTGQESTI